MASVPELNTFVNWLEATQPDVLAIQESKVVDELFPYDEYSKLGYYPFVYGQKAYNGVALLSKKEPINPTTGISQLRRIHRPE